MTVRAEPVQQRYQRLVQAIEDRFEVDGWRSGDIDLWPPARTDLFLDMFRQDGGDTAPPAPALAAAHLSGQPRRRRGRDERRTRSWASHRSAGP